MSSITPRPFYFLSWIIPISVIIGNYVGDIYVGTATFIGLVVFPVLDLILGDGKDRTPESTSPHFFDFILYGHVFLQFIAIASFFYFIQSNPAMNLMILATLSTGFGTGISGIVVAHELIHRKGLPLSLIHI